MRFVVEWKKTAIDELTALWLIADSAGRTAITVAARDIDRLLQADPHAQGESRESDRRVMFVRPLAAAFRIDSRTSRVDVLRIWQFER